MMQERASETSFAGTGKGRAELEVPWWEPKDVARALPPQVSGVKLAAASSPDDSHYPRPVSSQQRFALPSAAVAHQQSSLISRRRLP